MSMINGWTGGQYSIVRMLFGAYLFVHLVSLVPFAHEVFVDVLPRAASPLLYLFPNVLAVADVALPLIVAGSVASLLLAVGWHDRIAAIAIWYVLACLFGRNPLISNPSLPFAGWLLLFHAAMPRAPYLSWAARRRVDPGGGWAMPAPLYGAVWVVMSVAYSYSGWTKLMSHSWVDGTALARVLANPLARPSMVRDAVLSLPSPVLAAATWGALLLELLFAPLALSRTLRPWIWTAMLAMHLGLMVMIDFADLSFMMVIVHLFSFDPSWVRPRVAASTDAVRYDGTCALCHGAVRFLLAEDSDGNAFTFKPLDREPGAVDSVVVETAGGATLLRSRAVLYLLQRLGGMWRVIAIAGALLPQAIADRLYDFIAMIRYRTFGRTSTACPILPPSLRARFRD